MGLVLGNDYYGAQAPSNEQLQQALAQKHYAANMPAKEQSVQERIAHTLHELMGAHTTLDILEGNVGAEGSPLPPLGLLQGALACEEQASRLTARLQSLRDRLGNL